MPFTIADVKGYIPAFTPVILFDVVDNAGTTRYWATRACTWTNPYTALVLSHSDLSISMGVYGVEAIPQISLALNNTDAALNTIITRANFQGAKITVRLIFYDPITDATSSDSKCFGIFTADAPTATWPVVEITAWNALNFVRKTLPLSVITRYDRYPFPSTAAERTLAGADPTSPFYAIGYNPKTAKGAYAITDILADIHTTLTIGSTTSAGLDAAYYADYLDLPIGLQVEITAGTGAGQVRDVTSKTLDTLTVGVAFAPAPDPTSHFVAYYTATSYNGTRDSISKGDTVGLKMIGLSARFGGFGDCPETISYAPKKGEHAEFVGSANEAKYGQVVPLCYGIVRTQPPVLDTGAWPGGAPARLSHLLLCDGVNFADSDAHYGIGGALDDTSYRQVILPDQRGKKFYSIPPTSNDTSATGSWHIYTGKLDSQVPAVVAYRNIILATDCPGEKLRDLYSGLAHIVIGYPKELAEPGNENGPKTEVIFKGLQVETWGDAGAGHDWIYTNNTIRVYIDALKRLGWDVANIDEDVAYHSADYCDVVVNGSARFRCNLALMAKMPAITVLRGIRNNARIYHTYGSDGKLQIRVMKTFADEGGAAFTLDTTNILRDDSGQLLVKKWHKSVLEVANIYSCNFQNEDRNYASDTATRADADNIDRVGQVDGDSLTAILGIPSYDQAIRILDWIKYENVDANEFYTVTCTSAMIEAQVGQVGTITEPRHGLVAQQCRIRTWTLKPDGTVELVLQLHGDAGYGDTVVVDPLVRAMSDSTYSPRSVGAVAGVTGNPTLTETFISSHQDTSVDRRITAQFSVPSRIFETSFTSRPTVSAHVHTTGGTIPDNQILFVEICPKLAGVEGLPSDCAYVNVPAAGANTNSIDLSITLPAEADSYVIRIGQYPGKCYKHSAPAWGGTNPVLVTITTIAALDSSSLSPDPFFDHVRAFYYYDTTPTDIHDAGRTDSPTQTTFTFEPDGPASADVSITVILCSADAADKDFYPFAIAPRTTLAITSDTAIPTLPGAFGANLAASANGLAVLVGVIATANIKSIVQAEFLFKFTLDLVATMDMSAGVTKTVTTPGNLYGASAEFIAEQPGRVFFDIRLRNAFGWSLWLSGGATPGTSSFYCDTVSEIDTGPPAGWAITLEDNADDAAIPTSKVRAKLTLTGTNNANLLFIDFQIKDSSTGAWRAVDANAGAAVTYYDGSAVAHQCLDGGIHVKKAAAGYGTSSVGDLILLDVRGGAFGVGYCQWGTIVDFLDDAGNPIAVGSATQLLVQGRFRPQVTSDLRVKIVKPPWTWASEGYLGPAGYPTEGQLFVAGMHQKIFYSGLIDIGQTKASLDVRAWVENHYCRSDASTPGGSPTVSAVWASVVLITAQTVAPDNVPVAGWAGDPQTYFIDAANPDTKSSYIELYWRYTQGTNVATSFLVVISDGLATATKEVPAYAGAGVVTYGLAIQRLINNASRTVSAIIFAQYKSPSGTLTTAQVVLCAAIDPSADIGTDRTPTIINLLDWAGGNVWWETEQYRNNTAPDNAPTWTSATIAQTG